MKRFSLTFVLLVGAGIGLYEAFQHGWVRFNYPSPSRYPFAGVDVSHHRGDIDWAAARADGIAFAYIKATEGGDLVDSRFKMNWDRARAAGLAVGAYHFFTFCRDGASQASNFLDTVPRAVDALPPAVDLEFGGNCSKVPGEEELFRQLRAFLDPVRAATGREPVLYITREFFDAHLKMPWRSCRAPRSGCATSTAIRAGSGPLLGGLAIRQQGAGQRDQRPRGPRRLPGREAGVDGVPRGGALMPLRSQRA